jgi:hypothetical protein
MKADKVFALAESVESLVNDLNGVQELLTDFAKTEDFSELASVLAELIGLLDTTELVTEAKAV